MLKRGYYPSDACTTLAAAPKNFPFQNRTYAHGEYTPDVILRDQGYRSAKPCEEALETHPSAELCTRTVVSCFQQATAAKHKDTSITTKANAAGITDRRALSRLGVLASSAGQTTP